MATGRKKILILEDEGLIAMMLEDLVRDLGLAPVVAGTIDDALKVIDGGEIDLAILDYKIRDQNSAPVALTLRHRSIPFIVCSGLNGDGMTGAFDGAPRLGKPFQDSDLRAAIFAALA